MRSILSPSRPAFLAGLLFASGCQTARMALPPPLDQRADVMPCVGRQGLKLSEKFSFGPYQVEKVKRGWTKRFTWSISYFERTRARQSFEYELRTPGGALWHGQAATGVKKSDLKGELAGGTLTWGLSSEVGFVVRLARDGEEKGWTLTMAEGPREVLMTGHLSDGRAVFRVEATRQLAGTSIPLMETAGFLFYEDALPVAAVEVINQGAVRIDPGLDPARREAVAAAATALLLYKDVSRP